MNRSNSFAVCFLANLKNTPSKVVYFF